MYHITITDLSTGKTEVDMDSNCIIGACDIANEKRVQGFGVIQATRGTVRNVVTTLLNVVEDACTDGEDRSLYNRVMIPVILKAMKLMGDEPEDRDRGRDEMQECDKSRAEGEEPADWVPGGGGDEHAD